MCWKPEEGIGKSKQKLIINIRSLFHFWNLFFFNVLYDLSKTLRALINEINVAVILSVICQPSETADERGDWGPNGYAMPILPIFAMPSMRLT